MNKDLLKYRVFDTVKHRYLDSGEWEFLLHDDGTLLLGNWHGEIVFAYPGLVVERCTGLKDHNGNLMYENDIVSARGGDYKIVWSDTECGWAIQHTKSKLCRSMNCFDGDEFVIQNTGDKK